MIFLDTCAVIDMRGGDVDWVERPTRKLLDAHDLVISPMVLMELDFLREIGRLKIEPGELVADLMATVGLAISQSPFYEVVREASGLTWTRDPFDRMIVAQAQANRAALLTRDDRIHAHYPKAIQ